MHRDHPQRSHRRALNPQYEYEYHERKEWSHLADDRHELDDDVAERNPGSAGKALRAYGARSEEAARQIRELRARY